MIQTSFYFAKAVLKVQPDNCNIKLYMTSTAANVSQATTSKKKGIAQTSLTKRMLRDDISM